MGWSCSDQAWAGGDALQLMASASRLTGLRQSSARYFLAGCLPASLRAAGLAALGSISLASAVRRQGQPAQGIVPVGKALQIPRQPQQGSPRMMHQLARGAEDQKPQTLGSGADQFGGQRPPLQRRQ